MKPSKDFARLIEIMAALRTPGTGCAWDLAQTFATVVPYTIEEAYEVADAVARNDLHDLKDELGDLLLQVVFHARMAEEVGAFAFGDVVEAITSKLIRRHPHVFGGEVGHMSPEAVSGLWARIKAAEKAERAAHRGDDAGDHDGVLACVKAGRPALARALALQQAASTVGFDWNDPRAVLRKLREELDEIEQALDHDDMTEAGAEVGDFMFAVVNLARHIDADPEGVLAATNAKFERRFAHIERRLAARGIAPADATLEEMEDLWTEAKRLEKK